MTTTSKQFLTIGILFLLLGIIFGLSMAMSNDHSQTPTHAHVMLAGWATSTLFALVYNQFPAVAERIFARIHVVVHFVGLAAMVYGLRKIYSGDIPGGEPFAAAGSMIFALGALGFAVMILLAMWKR